MTAQLFLLAVFDGISCAALVFLVAVGLTLIFGVLRILNVAHGSFYAVGAYATASLGGAIFAAGFAPWLAFPLMLIAAVAIGVVVGGPIEKLLLSRIYGMDQVLRILVTFAVFMMLQDTQRLIWGVQPFFEATALNLLGTVEVAGITYTACQLIFLPVTAVLVLFGLRAGLRHTLTGGAHHRRRRGSRGGDHHRHRRRAHLSRDLHRRRVASGIRRGAGPGHHLGGAGHGRRHDRVVLCRRGDRGSRPDRECKV